MKMTIVAAAMVSLCAISQGHAQQRAFLSASGTGSTCTQGTPCSSLSAAYDVAGAGGTIYVVSPGYWINIGASFAPNIIGFGEASSFEYIAIEGPSSQSVALKNLSVSGSWSSFGLAFSAPGSFALQNVSLGNPRSSNLSGVLFSPSGAATLTLKDVRFDRMSAGSGAAIRIKTNGYNVNVSLENVHVSGGVAGIIIDASAGGFAKVSIKDSTFANIAGVGIGAYSGTGNIRLYLDNVTSVNNTHGLVAHGARTIAWLGSSTIAGNSIGVLRQSGGAVQSYKDNYIFNNNTDGTPLSGSYAPAAVGIGDEVAAAGR